MAETKLIKLATGEEILARYEQVDATLVLQNPMKLALSPKGLAMVPLSPFMKENSKITIALKDVIYTVDADEDVLNGYNSQFGGIVLAPTGLVID
jgi:hypothetical protein